MRAGSERSGGGGWGHGMGQLRSSFRVDWLELRVEGDLAHSPSCWASHQPKTLLGPSQDKTPYGPLSPRLCRFFRP